MSCGLFLFVFFIYLDSRILFKISEAQFFICTHLHLATFMTIGPNYNTSNGHLFVGDFAHIRITNSGISKALGHQDINY